MSKWKTILISAFSGFITGSVIVAFAMGAFGNPQFVDARVLNETLIIEKSGETLYIPKGTTVQMTNNIDGQPYYSLHFIGWPDVQSAITKADKWEYYFIKRQSK